MDGGALTCRWMWRASEAAAETVGVTALLGAAVETLGVTGLLGAAVETVGVTGLLGAAVETTDMYVRHKGIVICLK